MEEYKSVKESKNIANKHFKNNRIEESLKINLELKKKIEYIFKEKKDILDEVTAHKFIEEASLIYLNIARCYFKLKMYNNVIEYTNNLIELDSNHVKAIYLRCFTFIELKNKPKAIEDYNRLVILKLNNDNLEDLNQKIIDIEILDNSHQKSTNYLNDKIQYNMIIYKNSFNYYLSSIKLALDIIIASILRK